MASTKNNLYSIGPGSIGPGTSVVRSVLSPQRESGVITRMHQDENGISANTLADLYTLSESTFPGTAITLDYTRIKQLSNTLALVVSYYGQGSSASGFRTVMTRTPGGYRDIPSWPKSDADLTEYSGKSYNYNNNTLRPEFNIRAPLTTIQWSNTVYSDLRPGDNSNLVGKVNSNSYTIDGYSHAVNSLRFEGTQIQHDKYGGYDRWTLRHTVSYDPYYLWRSDYVRPQDEDATTVPTPYVRPFSDGVMYLDEATFPNLP